ncbi:hypothetical protein GOQ30_00180 [Flavobacterium sp. TP390]|uniref:Uncharacterized protein n=1 Tax=Flavobacterium profundi TaxID=1774945 RepID=A0A6I4IDC4_9FLAO|nr:hypothetical protein [Flavobacterium profundi]MVO07574.1 hypothetical protein [Flavobacterium profundi]
MKATILALLLVTIGQVYGQSARKVNYTDYVRDVQKWDKNENNMALSFWIPTSFWKVIFQDNEQFTPGAINQIQTVFDDFVIICALNMDVKFNGAISYTSDDDLKKEISIIDSNGIIYTPLQKEELSSEVLSFLNRIRPTFSNMMGKMGEGMHFYVFEVKDKKGLNLINEYQKGEFTVKHSNREFKYELPLVSLLPTKECSVDHAEMKGNWNFCPIHGVKLESVK